MKNAHAKTMTRRATAAIGAGLFGAALMVGSAAQAAQGTSQDVEKRIAQLEQRIEKLESRTSQSNVVVGAGTFEKFDDRPLVEILRDQNSLYGN